MLRSCRSRLFALLIVSALALLSSPSQAGSSGARMTDPAGDMAVPSLDIRSGLIRLHVSKSARLLTMSVAVGGDITGVPADYDFVTGAKQGSTCHALATRVRWNGVGVQTAYQRSSTFACQSEPTTAALAALTMDAAAFALGGVPVKAVAVGRTVGVTLAAPRWLSAGSLAGFAVMTHTPVLGLSSYTGMTDVRSYDLAALTKQWRVG